MKKALSFALALVTVLIFPLNVFAFTGDAVTPKVGGSGIGYQEEIISTVLQEHWAFASWHPEVDEPDYGLSAWTFTTSKSSFTISLGASFKFASVSVSANSGVHQVGKTYDCIYREWSRPAIYADIYLQTYKSGMYNFNTKKWVNCNTKTRYIAKNSIIKIVESSNMNDLL